MSYCGLGGVIRGLWLWDVDDGTGHAADEDHGAGGGFALHQVLCYTCGEEVCAVYVDAPELLHAFVGVANRVEVLGEACAGD